MAGQGGPMPGSASKPRKIKPNSGCCKGSDRRACPSARANTNIDANASAKNVLVALSTQVDLEENVPVLYGDSYHRGGRHRLRTHKPNRYLGIGTPSTVISGRDLIWVKSARNDSIVHSTGPACTRLAPPHWLPCPSQPCPALSSQLSAWAASMQHYVRSCPLASSPTPSSSS
jgi:hypothetical protein